MAEASQAPETKVRLSGDRIREITYLGRGITGPGYKGPVVRGQGEGHHVTGVAGIRCHLLAYMQKHEI